MDQIQVDCFALHFSQPVPVMLFLPRLIDVETQLAFKATGGCLKLNQLHKDWRQTEQRNQSWVF